MVLFGFCAYLFFFAFFFAAILFSSKLSKFRASVAGGARIQSPCIESLHGLVKRKVIVDDEKVERDEITGDRSQESGA